MKLWLDDVRPAPEGWVWAKTLAEAKQVVLDNLAERDDVLPECSLDHDLGATPEMIEAHGLGARGAGEETGLDFVKWLVAEGQVPRRVTIHSWNPVGAREMAQAIVEYDRALDGNSEVEYLSVTPFRAG